ncbi:MAG: hypothetical protein GYB37_13060 [Algicola sp.]|nr:hypothetical protein [Algicola sp.]
MKFFSCLLALMCCLAVSNAMGQTLSGKLNVEGWNKITEWKSQEPVSLFKNFRDGKHKILFRFKNTSGDKEIVLFQMKTTLAHNGKTIGTSQRSDWPWLPGDMYVPAEAFDFIPLLQKAANGNKGKLMPGTYEIRLEMKPAQRGAESIHTTLALKII